jgi:hypothetical protein
MPQHQEPEDFGHRDLALRGRLNPVAVDVALKDGHYLGSATIKQRDFGITPVSIAGGTVKVKDEDENRI